jgi:hypothetical protein
MAFGPAGKERGHVIPEVLDDDLDLLGDVVRVEGHPPHHLPHGGGALDHGLVVGLAVVCQPERHLVGRVVPQHVEDELLFDGLTHRIHVERAWDIVRRGLREGSGRVPKSSMVLLFGVAVYAMNVRPPSSARASI